MEQIKDLALHVEALSSAMQSDKDLFAPLTHYVREIGRVLMQPNPESQKSVLLACAEKIRAFYADYPPASSTPGFLYIPPAEVSATRDTAADICRCVADLAALPEDQFIAAFRPKATKTNGSRKPLPEHVAQVCRNGHLILSSLQQFPQFKKSFCEECGAPAIESCQSCSWPIAGRGPDSWMGGGGPYRPPRYCGECGKPFPWTETALAAAREYTDDLDELSAEEKATLKGTFDDLAVDTARTPLAANRFKKFMTKVGPVAADVLQKIIETVATEAAKKAMGF